MDRRSFLRSAAGAAVAGPAALGAAPATAAAAPSPNPFSVLKYRLLVPEIFRPLPDPATHTPVIVIGSGFGGAVTAWRLAQAGVQCAVLERGSRWPIPSDRREIFSLDATPDGRGLWRRTSFTGVTGIPVPTDWFGGVLDVTEFDGLDVWRASAVGGGSIVYTGAHPIPEQRYFEHLFGATVPFGEMSSRWYPLASRMLGTSEMPDDVYNADAYAHSRVWDEQSRRAGYTPQKIPGIWNWDVMRQEIRGRIRQSATISESNYGNANGVKRGLQLNYLRWAEDSGRATVYPGHEVTSIEAGERGGYVVTVEKVSPTGRVERTRTLTCDRLVLAAGSVGTTELLLRARQQGGLPNLNEYVGEGFGTNGDAAIVRGFTPTGGFTQGAASRSKITDIVDGLPVTFENWYVPGLPVDLGLVGSLGMTLDDLRATYRVDADGRIQLTWPGQPDSVRAMDAVNRKIADASNVPTGAQPFAPSVNSSFTAHPLGGAVIGKATDAYGRVHGHQGLYVMDGALIPGNAGAVNPSITITALAERNLAQIVASGG